MHTGCKIPRRVETRLTDVMTDVDFNYNNYYYSALIQLASYSPHFCRTKFLCSKQINPALRLITVE